MDVEAIYTLKGLELKAKMEMGVPLDITRIVAGAGRDGDLSTLESISDIRQELTITGEIRRGTQSIVFAVLENKGLAAGYDLTRIGVMANDPDEGEILYRVSELARAFPISAEKDFPNFAIDCTFTDTVSNASEVHVTVDPAGMVTVSQLEVVQALAQEALAVAQEGGGSSITIDLPDGSSLAANLRLKLIGGGRLWIPLEPDEQEPVPVPGVLFLEDGTPVDGKLELDDGSVKEMMVVTTK